MSYMAEAESRSVENDPAANVPRLMWQACMHHLAGLGPSHTIGHISQGHAQQFGSF